MGVDIIGMGLGEEDLTEVHKKIIKKADLIIGGRRHLESFKGWGIETLVISKDIDEVVEAVKKRMDSERVVVLASGDPLFFGIGATLIRELGKEGVTVHPNISSLGAAFSAIKEPWHDALLISLHGRDPVDLVSILKTHSKIGILTDQRKTPSFIAATILENNISGFRLWVMERLGTPHGIITSHDDMEKVVAMTFAMPNVVVLIQEKGNKKNDHPYPVWPGMDDGVFAHEKGLITKSEVRIISISKLKLLSDNHTVWDLGAGSGSVGIEISRFVPRGKVICVEKNKKRIADIRTNVERFRVTNLSIVHGKSLDIMDKLPDPDRIFIGGGGKELLGIIARAGQRLSSNGVMVINTVLIQNMAPVVALLKRMGFKPDLIQVQISKLKSMPVGDRLEALNPVWVISGEKNKE